MRTILVTGASRGLGLAIAARLLQETDTRIAAVARSETDDFRAFADAHPDRLVLFRQDLAELDALHGLVREITAAMGPLYGLVNNAAIGLDGLLATQHASDISRVLRLNLESPILLTKYACRSMLTVGTGRIVNVGSIIASTGFSGLSVYGATKAGLEGFTRSLARELGRAKITVNCLAPGYMETEMTAGLTEDKLASVRRRAPLGLPKPEDVAGAVAYLMSSEAAMVTGTVMTVDGGSTA
ncbi:MAG: SDR family NAD(P)-dependent oxidoreductase [Pannonibacter sp.]|jgi:3-oxoacyl-[acyl-carrier protein] reductase